MSSTTVQSSPNNDTFVSQPDDFSVEGMLKSTQSLTLEHVPSLSNSSTRTITLWESLSDEEKANSFGTPFDDKWKSWSRWGVRGRLSEIWKEDVRPVLDKLEQDNYRYIYGSRGRSGSKILEPALLCATTDRHGAQPTALITLESRRARSRMKTLFEKHQHVKELNSGFLFSASKGHGMLRAADAPLSSSTTNERGPCDSLCGSAAFATKLPPTEESTWRKATIGGVIFDSKGGAYYAVTAYHCLRHQESSDSSENTESDDSDSESETDIRHESDDSISKKAFQLDLKFGVYLDCASDKEPGEEGSASGKKAPHSLALVGEESRPTTNESQLSLEALDCALVRVFDTRFMQRNCIQTPWSTRLFPSSVQPNCDAPYGEAILASGTSGVKKVTISGTEVSFKFPWDNKSQVMWSLSTRLAPGDSGSWVLSPDGNTLYGMAVATSSIFETAYLIRGEDLLNTIAMYLGLKVSPNDVLPTNGLKDLQLAKLRHCLQDPFTIGELINKHRMTLPGDLASNPSFGTRQPQDSGYDSTSRVSFGNMTPFSEIGELERQLFDEVELLKLRQRWPGSLVSFLEIPQGDHEACRDFLLSHTKLVDMSNSDENLLFQEAVAAYKLRYKVFAYTCTERIVILRMLKVGRGAYPIRQLYEDLRQENSSINQQFNIDFDEILETVKDMGRKLVPVSSLAASSKPSDLSRSSPSFPKVRGSEIKPSTHGPGVSHSLIPEEAPSLQQGDTNIIRAHQLIPPFTPGTYVPAYEPTHYSILASSFSGHQQTPYPVPRSNFSASQRMVSIGAQSRESTEGQQTSKSLISLQEEPENGQESDRASGRSTDLTGMAGKTRKSLHRYYCCYRGPDEKLFFVVGKVFGTLISERAGCLSSTRSEDSNFRYEDKLFYKVRRLIVVKVKHGCSWCFSITTYGGRGIAKPSLSRQDIEDHAPVALVGTHPYLSPEERARNLTKAPLMVVPSTPSESLDRMSRINFGKLYTIEHNVEVRDIGMIAEQSMPNLLHYTRMTFERE